MKNFFLLFGLLSCMHVFGEDGQKKFQIGINISPDYCYRSLRNTNGSMVSSWIAGLRNEDEIAKIGYTAGLNGCYNFNQHFSIEIGLQYSDKGYKTKETELLFGDLIDPRYGFVYPQSTMTSYIGVSSPKGSFIYHHYYLDFPMRINFMTGKKKFSFVIGLGIAANFFLQATTTSVLEYSNGVTREHTSKQIYHYELLDVSPTISAGVDYKVNSKINLRAEPTVRYGLLKIIDAPVTGYLWNAGLNFSCYYGLK